MPGTALSSHTLGMCPVRSETVSFFSSDFPASAARARHTPGEEARRAVVPHRHLGEPQEPLRTATAESAEEPAPPAPLAGAAAHRVAAADDEIELLRLEARQHPWQQCLIVLQVGIHHGDVGRRARQDALDTRTREATPS